VNVKDVSFLNGAVILFFPLLLYINSRFQDIFEKMP